MTDVVLHQWLISPFCSKVRRVLDLKGVGYRTIEYNGMRAPLAVRLSKAAKMPVLEWDGERVQDSSDIIAFIESRKPEPRVYPEDAIDRARALVLEDWADESLYFFELYFRFADDEARPRAMDLLCEGRPRFERRLFARVATGKIKKQLAAQGISRLPRHRVEEAFFGHLENLETMLEPTGWLVGERQSIADIAVAAQLDEVIRTSPLADRVLGHRRLASWLERQRPRSK